MKKIFFLLLVIVLCTLGYGYSQYHQVNNAQISQDTNISIQKGDTLIGVLHKEFGYHAFWIRVYFYLNPDQKIHIQAGDFFIPEGSTIQETISLLGGVAKNSEDIKITLLEGWNIFDIDGCLSQSSQEFLGCMYTTDTQGERQNFTTPLIHSGEFATFASQFEVVESDESFLHNLTTLEGFLYPDTYFINPNNFSLYSFTQQLLNNFQTTIYTPLLSSLSQEELYTALIMASIVEKEEKNPQERPIVAGILLKRYENNWMIGADITACYAYQLTSQECKLSLSKYIFDTNSYNTRTMVGLPITPISNPSKSAIISVLEPQESQYWYYLHDTETGKIYYATDEQGHNQNKRLYIK